MGISAQKRAVKAMLMRWYRDEARLQELFGGSVTTEDLTTSGEILRNLGTAIAYAELFLVART